MQQARDFIKTGKVGRVATITIDHPPTNSISTGILQDLAALVAEYEADDAVRAILLDSANQKPPFAAIESMFNRLKDFRRIATRYDRLATNFHAAVCIAATVSY